MPSITRPCVQCRAEVRFPGAPADAICEACGLKQYVNSKGQTGRYPHYEQTTTYRDGYEDRRDGGVR